MKDRKSFDGDLQMFRDAPQPVNMDRLRFLRWLAEQGRLEHPVVGRPRGEFAAAAKSRAPADGVRAIPLTLRPDWQPGRGTPRGHMIDVRHVFAAHPTLRAEEAT